MGNNKTNKMHPKMNSKTNAIFKYFYYLGKKA